MRNKKFSNILKISILTLLIILGTVGNVNADQVSHPGMYWEEEASGASGSGVNQNDVGFDTLENHNFVFCDEHGKELSNAHHGKPTAQVIDYDAKFTRYFYDTKERNMSIIARIKR